MKLGYIDYYMVQYGVLRYVLSLYTTFCFTLKSMQLIKASPFNVTVSLSVKEIIDNV